MLDGNEADDKIIAVIEGKECSTMTKRSIVFSILMFTAAVLTGATLAAHFATVTFVMKNGERISGTFSYNHTDQYQLIVNGRERSYPSNDIAMIAFVSGDPSPAEINRLPDVNDPPELERHTIVLRNGDMIRGKIWDFQGDRIIMDIRAGDRRTYNMNDTARLYISAPGARGVFQSVVVNSGRGRQQQGGQGQGQGQGQARGQGQDQSQGRGQRLGPGQGPTIVMPANACWTRTGIYVDAGQNVAFASSGEIQLSNDRNDLATVAGSKTGRYARNAPIPGALLGALIGRIDNRRPFGIGDQRQPLGMPFSGELWLGINDDQCQDNRGEFRVRVDDRR